MLRLVLLESVARNCKEETQSEINICENQYIDVKIST